MLHKSIIGCAVFSTVLLLSCGTNKKLQTAQAQVDELQAQNNQLSQQVTSMKKQVSELSARNQSMAEDYASYKAKCDATTEKYVTLRKSLNEEAENLDRVEEKLTAALVDFES